MPQQLCSKYYFHEGEPVWEVLVQLYSQFKGHSLLLAVQGERDVSNILYTYF